MPSIRAARRRAPLAAPALLLGLLLVACDGAPVPSPSAPTSVQPSVGRCGAEEVAGGGIDGRVVDAEGSPLTDIFVIIETSDGFRGDTRTGDDGVFRAPDIAGEFTITTVDIDYASVTQRVTVPCGQLVEVELVLTPNEE